MAEYRNTKKRSRLARVLSFTLCLTWMLQTSVQAAMTAQGIEVTATAQMEGEDAQEYNEILEVSQIRAAAGQMRAEDGLFQLFNLDVIAAGQEMLKAAFEVSDEGVLALSIPTVDPNRYEVDLNVLIPALQEEVLGLFSQMDPSGSLSGGLNLLQPIEPPFSAEELVNALDPYGQILSDQLGACTYIEEDVPIYMDKLDAEITADQMTVLLEEDDIAAVLEAIGQKMKEDQDLEQVFLKLTDFLQKNSVMMSVLMSMYVPGINPEDLTELAEEMKQEFSMLPDTLLQTAQSIREKGIMDGARIIARTAATMEEDEDIYFLLTLVDEQAGDELRIGLQTLQENSSLAVSSFLEDYDADLEYFRDSLELKFTSEALENVLMGQILLKELDETALQVDYRQDLGSRSLLGLPYGEISVTALPLYLTISSSPSARQGDDLNIYMGGVQYLGLIDGDITGLRLLLHAQRTTELARPEGQLVDLSRVSLKDLLPLLEQLG